MRISTIPGALLAVLLLAGCGSSGGLGDILGGGGGNTSAATDQIEGTVEQVDTGSRSIVLTNVSTYGSGLQSGGYGTGSGTTARVYYDDRTTVEYQGQNYRPADLERGDRVAVRVARSGDRMFAEAIQVTYNSATGGGGGNAYGGSVRGTVSYVDNSRRTIQIDRGTGSPFTVSYDGSTWVEHQGRRYQPADLERGDEVEVIVQQTAAGVYVAQGINVIRSATTGGGTSAASTLRGTVRAVDTSRRQITLEQTSWVSRFNEGSLGNTVTLQYDNETQVEFQGRLYPPTNLERGDVVDVQVRDLGGSSMYAQRIVVVRDSSAL